MLGGNCQHVQDWLVGKAKPTSLCFFILIIISKQRRVCFFALIIIISQQLMIIALNGQIFFIDDIDSNFWERVSVHKLLHIQGAEAIIFAMDCYHRAI